MIEENFIKLYENSFKCNWDLPALTDYGSKTTLLYKDLAYEIAKLHQLFEYLDIKKGDKISLVGKNTINWCVTYMATITYGAVIVPILQEFHPDSIHYIIDHSESKFLFVGGSNIDDYDFNKTPNIGAVFSLDDFSCINDRLSDSKISSYLTSLDELLSSKYSKGFSSDDIKYADVDNLEVVLLNYTSGTTGFSKGVMLMANNLAGNVTYAKNLKLLFRGQRVVSFLPLAHAYGCAFDFLYALTEGVHITLLGKAPSPMVLSAAFSEIKPNLIVTVPLVIEKIYKKALLPKIEDKKVQLLSKIPGLRNLVYKKIKKGLVDALGGEFCEVIIGGAALSKEVESFLYKIKFPFTVGYGMTECGPLISYDHHYDFVPTSCGKILSIMEVRVDSSDPYSVVGEIQVRGENVMRGYYKNEEATYQAFTRDGWLRTGDLGTIDRTGRIYLKGRSKTMILGPNGQNIFPEEIEARLNNMPYVMESLVVCRNNRLVALVYPDYESLQADSILDEDIVNVMNNNKVNINKSLSNYEKVSDIELISIEFEKTPKKSIKRYLYE